MKNEIPRATSLVFTKEDIKKAIPKNAEERENNKPVYKKKIDQGIADPIEKPYTIAINIAKNTGKNTVINLPKILPQ